MWSNIEFILVQFNRYLHCSDVFLVKAIQMISPDLTSQTMICFFMFFYSSSFFIFSTKSFTPTNKKPCLKPICMYVYIYIYFIVLRYWVPHSNDIPPQIRPWIHEKVTKGMWIHKKEWKGLVLRGNFNGENRPNHCIMRGFRDSCDSYLTFWWGVHIKFDDIIFSNGWLNRQL